MKPLSMDLRERIVASVDAGESQVGTAKRFCVSRGSRTGSIAPVVPRPAYKIVAVHRRKMATLVRQQPDITLEELRVALHLTCTPQAIHYAFKSMGLPFKKRRFALKKPSESTCA
ncbi:MAG: IS630 transposase-related protein [Candidatus Methylacidiphilales bacterium]